MRRPALVLLLLALLAPAGCGSGEGDDATAPIAAYQVVREFADTPGLPKLDTNVPDTSWQQLSAGFDLTAAEQKRFGTFTVYVVDADEPESVSSLLSDKDTAAPLEPDANGIYWDFDELAQSWVAQKRYGQNVVLAWWNEKAQRGTDARWRRLDRALTDVANG